MEDKEYRPRVLQGSKLDPNIGAEMHVQLSLMDARSAELDVSEEQVRRYSINWKAKNGVGKMPPITADAVRYWLRQYLQSQPESEFWIEPVAILKLPEQFVVKWQTEADQLSHGSSCHSPEMSLYAAEFFAREQMWMGAGNDGRTTYRVERFPEPKTKKASV